MKGKRILALLGAIILIALYVIALVLAFVSHPLAQNLLLAALFCTIVVPCILYGYQIVLRYFTKQKPEQ